MAYGIRFWSLVSTRSNSGQESNEKKGVTRCCLLTFDSVCTLAQFVCFLYERQVRSLGFIKKLQAFDYLTTGLAVVLNYGRIQRLTIQDLWRPQWS